METIIQQEHLMELCESFFIKHGDDSRINGIHFMIMDTDSQMKNYKVYTNEGNAFSIEEYYEEREGIKWKYIDFRYTHDEQYEECPIEKAIEIIKRAV